MNGLRFTALILGVIGSVFTVIGVTTGVNTHSFVNSAITTQGTIVNFSRRLSTDSKKQSIYYYYPVIKFTAQNGEPTTFESNVGSNSPAYTQGQQVEVLYNPEQPKSAQINSWVELWIISVVFGGVGPLLLLGGLISLYYSFPRKKIN